MSDRKFRGFKISVLSPYLLVLVVIATIFIDLPGDSKLSRELQNTGHTFVFGLVAFLLLHIFRKKDFPKRRHSFYQYSLVFIYCLIAGIAVELIQQLFHRDADIYDVLRDVAGIFSFLCFYFAFDKDAAIGTGLSSSARKAMGLTLSFVVLMAALSPLTRMIILYYQRHESFPVLVDFSAYWAEEFIAENNLKINIVPAPDDWAQELTKTVAMIQLQKTKHQSFEIEELESNWTTYSNLNFKIFFRKASPLQMNIRIHDKLHNQQYNDRFNMVVNLKQGENVIKISLDEIYSAPASRKMDIKQIAGIILFTESLESPTNIYLSNIWLN